MVKIYIQYVLRRSTRIFQMICTRFIYVYLIDINLNILDIQNSILRSLITSFLTNCKIFTTLDNILLDGKRKALHVQSIKIHRCGEVTPLILGFGVRWAWMFRFRFQPLSSPFSSDRKLIWPQNLFGNCRERKKTRSCEDSNPVSASV